MWLLDAPASSVDVAYCYPYGVPEVETLLRETGGCWRADTIGVSQGGRALIRLSNSYGRVGGDRPGLYLVARQHSGETPGSWVLEDDRQAWEGLPQLGKRRRGELDVRSAATDL